MRLVDRLASLTTAAHDARCQLGATARVYSLLPIKIINISAAKSCCFNLWTILHCVKHVSFTIAGSNTFLGTVMNLKSGMWHRPAFVYMNSRLDAQTALICGLVLLKNSPFISDLDYHAQLKLGWRHTQVHGGKWVKATSPTDPHLSDPHAAANEQQRETSL